jgi:ribosomal protein L12E/L44/L45/RPP1/RPP2
LFSIYFSLLDIANEVAQRQLKALQTKKNAAIQNKKATRPLKKLDEAQMKEVIDIKI